MEEEKAKMSTGKKILIGLIAAFILLTAAAYIYGVYYFTNHLLPGSRVNGFNCSYMDEETAESLIAEKVGTYVLTIETKNNGKESITADEAGISYTPDGSIKRLMRQQDRFKWFLAFNQSKSYRTETPYAYDKEKLYAAVKGLHCMQPENITEPVDAAVRETETGYEITPETEGNAPDEAKLMDRIEDAVILGETVINLEKEDCYRKPAFYRDDEILARDCKRMTELTDVIITYDFADRTETVDRNIIKNWLVKDEGGEYTLDKNKVAAYINELGYKYDTFGCTRQFRTYDGRMITVSGGDYGWAIDQEAETEGLIQTILNGETVVREPVYAYSGWSRGTNDIGYTYVEIDLTNQRMVLYKDGMPIVDTPVVTGNPGDTSTATPVGCYALDAMQSPATLKGEGYTVPVTYWMPFCGNVGIHDAAWRNSFGGTIYMSDGSHGCINTPYDKAQAIYSNVAVGIPVIVYQ